MSALRPYNSSSRVSSWLSGGGALLLCVFAYFIGGLTFAALLGHKIDIGNLGEWVGGVGAAAAACAAVYFGVARRSSEVRSRLGRARLLAWQIHHQLDRVFAKYEEIRESILDEGLEGVCLDDQAYAAWLSDRSTAPVDLSPEQHAGLADMPASLGFHLAHALSDLRQAVWLLGMNDKQPVEKRYESLVESLAYFNAPMSTLAEAMHGIRCTAQGRFVAAEEASRFLDSRAFPWVT